MKQKLYNVEFDVRVRHGRKGNDIVKKTFNCMMIGESKDDVIASVESLYHYSTGSIIFREIKKVKSYEEMEEFNKTVKKKKKKHKVKYLPNNKRSTFGMYGY